MVCENIGVNDLGHLTFAGQDTVNLAKQYATPAYLMDEDGLYYGLGFFAGIVEKKMM